MAVDIDQFIKDHGVVSERLSPTVDQVSRGQAMRVACRLAKNPEVLGVDLFGSLTRKYHGNDMDLVVMVSDMRASQFMSLLTSWLAIVGGGAYDAYGATSIAAIRRRFAIMAVPSLRQSLLSIQDIVYPGHIDLFLFPRDWKQRVVEIQRLMPTWDPQFMQNLASSAIRLPSRCV